jgi:hypothetical protein
MPHLITIFCAVIAVLALIIFSFQQEEVPPNLLKPDHSQVKSTSTITQHEIASSNAAIEQSVPKTSKISATATRYYQQANEHGYESLVPAFENGAIANSNMSAKEKQKMCELTLLRVRVNELKRLEKANCHAQDGMISYRSINATLKTPDGQVDQTAIIEKLEYFRERDQLQTDVTYKIAELGYEEKDSMYNTAAGFGLDQVVDYLVNIDVPLPKNNLINDHLKGIHPNLAMIEKLQGLGYQLDSDSQKILQSARFQEKYADLYQSLSQ